MYSDIDHIENETEISFFNSQDYEDFKLNPEVSKCSLIVHCSPLMQHQTSWDY
jgi:hypothetical protein